ncbi:uncharacterized protein EAF02_011546 [Botrytis sinoallii]|uniref:uncharacterized protein n=1 Tax=Botrytis sinoallii TaxID=1463999 RepID=UPI0018FF62E1|nr:uncharacterized protein EAF02_011546 [Botrytis sinoallii]KAF7855287.1 hypothetical protein EAF02_011546 [Botrytis sinoallii]
MTPLPLPLPFPQRHAQASHLSSASPLRHFSLNLVLAKDSILINSYQPPSRKSRLRRLPLNLVRLPILEELDGMSTLWPKFDFVLRLIDLNNVPLTSGTAYIKWHISSSVASEHSGQTPRSPIKEHKVHWDYTRSIPVRLTIDKSNHLSECLIHFEVIQDYNSGATSKGERVTLGHITLNLAEYVEESEVEGEEGVVRRYLMQDSKINSTAKIGISMRQVEGERNFVAPILKSAPVFGGIAGIMKGETGDNGDDVCNMPQLQKSSDKSDLHDMYRRALAASWTCSPAEMPADECVEDIFAGGDGWKRDPDSSNFDHNEYSRDMPRIVQDDRELSASGGSGEDLRRHRRSHSDASQKSNLTTSSSVPGGGKVRRADGRGHRYKRSTDTTRSGVSSSGGRSVSAQSGLSSMGDRDDEISIMGSGERGRQGRGLGHIPGNHHGYVRPREVDEFDMREDLVAWKLPGEVS